VCAFMRVNAPFAQFFEFNKAQKSGESLSYTMNGIDHLIGVKGRFIAAYQYTVLGPNIEESFGTRVFIFGFIISCFFFSKIYSDNIMGALRV
jgi:hypothetical protein